MREDLLHFIWKHKKIPQNNLKLTTQEPITIVKIGQHNYNSGPDFFNSQVRIGEQLWVGNVEIHLISSDWYAHKHEVHANYNTVILHVVWEDDVSVYRNDNTKIPTLELKNYIGQDLLLQYKSLFSTSDKKFINCEKDIKIIDDFVTQNWLERLFFERLEDKTEVIKDLLLKSNNNWEYVLFVILLKSFGLKINGSSFLSLHKSLNSSVIAKLKNNSFQLESVLYGQLGLLEAEDCLDTYYLNLRKEYAFVKGKFKLSEEGVEKANFFRLRPSNFPTIRLSQFANLYKENQNLFSILIQKTSLEDLQSIFNVYASEYWDTHYNFGKESKSRKKRITKKFIDLMVINTIIPFKFYYAKSIGKDINEELINIISKIDIEDNTIIQNFKKNGINGVSAKDSQALIQLYNKYCTKNNCLQCAIGVNLLKGNT